MFGLLLLLSWSIADGSLFAGNARTVMESDVTKFSSEKWTRGERVSAEEELELSFWLKHSQEKLASFHELLMTLATPGSPRYGQWLSKENVTELLSPSDLAIDAVMAFAVSELGARDLHVNKDKAVVKVTVKAGLAESALQTRLYHHKHSEYSKVDIVRCAESSYSLPTAVAMHVSVVGELVRFPRLRENIMRNILNETELTTKGEDEWIECGAKFSEYTNPFVLASRYGFEFPKLTANPCNSMAVGEFQGQYYDKDDLKAFSDACGLEEIEIAKTIGGNSQSSCERGLEPCIESLLDMEYAGAIAGAIPLQVFYASDYSLLSFASLLSEADSPPLVVSVSYGNDEVQQTGSDFMEAVNTAFMKLGAQGMTIMFAAGDQGVWGRSGPGRTFHPDFPAGSPYVTAVGGTDFAEKSTIGEETTWADGGSGFSDEFTTPKWQRDEVVQYLDTDHLPKPNYYNSEGRGYPDLSALAGQVNPYLISFKDGTFAGVAGTSAACPVAAAMIAQINDKRLDAGKKPLGFLNPALYAAGEKGGAFNDVTSGTTSGSFGAGFHAEEGWDAATGWGTIIYDKLEATLVEY